MAGQGGIASEQGPQGPRRDTRGIVDAPALLARVRFRRRLPAGPLRRWVEHYWLIDWDLAAPYASHVVPHPCVNVVLERRGPAAAAPATGLVAGVGLGLFGTKLEGTGRVCGVQFRPGGFRPFHPADRPVAELTGRQLPLEHEFPAAAGMPERVLGQEAEDARVAALDTFLLGLGPGENPAAARAMALAHRIRTDRTVLRVERLAADEGVSVRTLQRLFAACVGVGPKWTILRYRVHEAMEYAATHPEAADWARVAAELGYSDQAHLARDFTAAVGVPPAAYARAAAQAGPAPQV